MTCFDGVDVSQKMTAICVVDNAGRRLWRGQCPTVPAQISDLVRGHAGDGARIGASIARFAAIRQLDRVYGSDTVGDRVHSVDEKQKIIYSIDNIHCLARGQFADH